MRRWFLPLVLVTVSVAFAGDGAAPGAAPAPGVVAPAGPAVADPLKALLARCRYTPAPFEMTLGDPLRVGEKVLVEKVSFPSPVPGEKPTRNDVVSGRYCHTESPEPAAVVFLGGWRFDPATPALALRLAQETGIQTLYLDLPFQGERTPQGVRPGQLTFSEDLDRDVDVFAQTAQDVARGVDWLVRERNVDPKRIGILGTSLGGYVAGDLYGMSDTFACGVMQIAGGDVASVVFNGNKLTSGIRDALIAKGLDEKAVRERMRPLDPSSWARSERKDALLLIAAENDDIVPLPTVKGLAAAYGGARVVVMPGARHIDPKALTEHFAEAVAHFRAHLLPAAAPPK